MQKLAPNKTRSIKKVSESTPNQHVTEVTQLSIMSLPIIHLSIPQENPPWTLLLKMVIAPLAAELHHRQSFAGRITLFQSNWKVLTSDPWVLETVIQGYHIPLTATPGQKSWPYTPHLPTRELVFLEEEIQILVQKQEVQEVPVTTKGYYLTCS